MGRDLSMFDCLWEGASSKGKVDSTRDDSEYKMEIRFS